ncbi:MAG: type 4a pilus biogenesis protein PilO [Thermodesulfobacteriota bacterium]
MNGDILKSITNLDLGFLKAFRRQALGLAVLAAFGLFFHRFIYLAGAEEVASLKRRSNAIASEKVRVAAEVAAVEGLKKKVSDAERRLGKVQSRLRSLRERLPSERQISAILSDISRGGPAAAGRAALIASIKPLAPEVKGELTRLPFQVNMETGFMRFGNYIERIERLPRIIIVDNFMLDAADGAETGRLAAQLHLSTYILGGPRALSPPPAPPGRAGAR